MSTANNPLLILLDLVPSPLILFSADGRVAFSNRAAQGMRARPVLSLPGDPNVRELVRAIGGGKIVTQTGIEVQVNSDEGIETLHCDCAPKLIAGLVAMSVTEVVAPPVSTGPAEPDPAGSGDGQRRERLSLQQIMALINADLAEPIGAVLEATRNLNPPQPGAGLGGPVLTLRERLERLSDLINVFGEDVLIGEERMLLPDMVRSVCQTLSPLARERSVSFLFDGEAVDLPPVYGSRHLIHRALYECLHNAVEHAHPAGTSGPTQVVKIGFHAAGAHLLLSVRNLGALTAPALTRFANGLFQAGSAPADETSTTGGALRIGLPLTQRILQLHGGRLKVQDDAGELSVMLELPAGAPLRNTHHLDLLQAQIYAEDLSKLMARSRRTA